MNVACARVRSAAKLGRRSRKMREMITEATRTIEDSQTAQALHGLLSLKSADTAFMPVTWPPAASGGGAEAAGSGTEPQTVVTPNGDTIEVTEVHAPGPSMMRLLLRMQSEANMAAALAAGDGATTAGGRTSNGPAGATPAAGATAGGAGKRRTQPLGALAAKLRKSNSGCEFTVLAPPEAATETATETTETTDEATTLTMAEMTSTAPSVDSAVDQQDGRLTAIVMKREEDEDEDEEDDQNLTFTTAVATSFDDVFHKMLATASPVTATETDATQQTQKDVCTTYTRCI